MAEVLITLGIIGVVAALTMPVLMQKHRSYVLHKQFLKSYSNLSQAILLMKTDLGIENFTKEFATYDTEKGYYNAQAFYDEFSKYIKAVDEVGQYSIKNYNATADAGMTTSGEDYPMPYFVLEDGSSVGRFINGARVRLYIDVNGPKKGPNRYGFDVFEFTLNKSDAVVPLKQTRAYTEEELENVQYSYVAGTPCNKNSKQAFNGIGCSWYAVNDINPDDESKKYWDSLPW